MDVLTELGYAEANVTCGGRRRRETCKANLGNVTVAVDGTSEWAHQRPASSYRPRLAGGWAVRCDRCGTDWAVSGTRLRAVLFERFRAENPRWGEVKVWGTRPRTETVTVRSYQAARLTLGKDIAA